MMLFDTVDATGARITNDGFLVAEAAVARTGIQLYSAAELGMDGNKVMRVYRPPEEVFAADAMASYAHRPVTVEHPTMMVDAGNWKEYAKGQTGDEVLRDGEFVRVPLMLMDKAAIDDWRDGKRELSMGYTMDLEVIDGQTPEGEQYDAVQRNLRMNHLALVSRARGGSKLRLGDRHTEDSLMSEVTLVTRVIDGITVKTTEPGAEVIDKLQSELADARKDLKDSQKTHDTALAAKDTELATKDAEIDSLKDKQLSDADLDKRVNDRADLIATAKSVADKDYTGKSDVEIRKTAVMAVLGADAVTDKSDEYIQARFDILAEDAGQDPVRKVVRNGTRAGDAVETAHKQMSDDIGNAWKQKGGNA